MEEKEKSGYSTMSIVVFIIIVLVIIVLIIWGYTTAYPAPSSSTSDTSLKDYFFAKKEEIATKDPPKDIKNFNFNDLNIGGLNDKTKDILKELLYVRYLSDDLKTSLNVKNIKGILLYGPPGCGKTLIASQIATILGAKNIKTISGPELLNKYVGESEKNVRDLFYEAEKDPKHLYVIICDEFDSIAKRRDNLSAVDSHVHGDMVNQLLSKLDGVHGINNVLFICTTNNLPAIDPAILRSGRIETLIEISTPNADGRKEIFNIYLNKIDKKHKHADISIDNLVNLSEGFSGADICEVVEKAKKTALYKNNNIVVIHQEYLVNAISTIQQSKKIKDTAKDDGLDRLKKLFG